MMKKSFIDNITTHPIIYFNEKVSYFIKLDEKNEELDFIDFYNFNSSAVGFIYINTLLRKKIRGMKSNLKFKIKFNEEEDKYYLSCNDIDIEILKTMVKYEKK